MVLIFFSMVIVSMFLTHSKNPTWPLKNPTKLRIICKKSYMQNFGVGSYGLGPAAIIIEFNYYTWINQ
jgi:hypothetical protein